LKAKESSLLKQRMVIQGKILSVKVDFNDADRDEVKRLKVFVTLIFLFGFIYFLG
jgi:hypothetical protein